MLHSRHNAGLIHQQKPRLETGQIKLARRLRRDFARFGMHATDCMAAIGLEISRDGLAAFIEKQEKSVSAFDDLTYPKIGHGIVELDMRHSKAADRQHHLRLIGR